MTRYISTKDNAGEKPKSSNRGRKPKPKNELRENVIRFKVTDRQFELIEYLRHNSDYGNNGSFMYEMLIQAMDQQQININQPGEVSQQMAIDFRNLCTTLNVIRESLCYMTNWGVSKNAEDKIDEAHDAIEQLVPMVRELYDSTFKEMIKVSVNEEIWAKIAGYEAAGKNAPVGEQLQQRKKDKALARLVANKPENTK